MRGGPDPGPPHSCAAVAEEKNPAAVAPGKLGASKGGKARAEKLSDERRSEITRKAAKARWAKKRQQEEGAS